MKKCIRCSADIEGEDDLCLSCKAKEVDEEIRALDAESVRDLNWCARVTELKILANGGLDKYLREMCILDILLDDASCLFKRIFDQYRADS